MEVTEESTTASAITDGEQLEARVAKLDSIIFQCRARRREASIEAGRALIELKELLNHGKWQRHVEETFGPHGITLRTAERWMERARKAEADSKNDKLSSFKPATDKFACEIRAANAGDSAEVESVAKLLNEKKDSKRVYRLALRMTASEVESMERLRKSPNWSKAQRKVVHLLRKLFVKYEVATDDGGSH